MVGVQTNTFSVIIVSDKCSSVSKSKPNNNAISYLNYYLETQRSQPDNLIMPFMLLFNSSEIDCFYGS